MKIRLFSDLHVEFYSKECDLDLSFSDCDIVILAGDIHIKSNAVNWVNTYFSTDKPVLYVLGNHEYYHSAHPQLVEQLKEQTSGSHIHILENDVFEFKGVNFLGCTLWTDLNLFKTYPLTANACQQGMSDYKKIHISPGDNKFNPDYSVQLHKKSLDFLRKELVNRVGQKNFVITHHAPSPQSLPYYLSHTADEINAAYASNLDAFIEEYRPDFWVHGHIHESFKYNIGETQILSNPRGYLGYKNPVFDPGFTIEI